MLLRTRSLTRRVQVSLLRCAQNHSSNRLCFSPSTRTHTRTYTRTYTMPKRKASSLTPDPSITTPTTVDVKHCPVAKIVSVNVNGLRACAKKPAFIEYLQAENADVVCMQETKCRASENPLADMEAIAALYPYSYFADNKEKKGSHGVGVLCKTEPLSIHYGLTPEYTLDEGRAITLVYDSVVIVQTYVANSGQKLKFKEKRLAWNIAMSNYLTYLKDTYNHSKEIIWTGDLNVAHLDYDVYDGESNKQRKKSSGFTPYERQHMTEVLESGFLDIYAQQYPDIRGNDRMTFWTARMGMKAKKKGWRLDYFITTPGLLDRIDRIEHQQHHNFSDHVPIVLTLKE